MTVHISGCHNRAWYKTEMKNFLLPDRDGIYPNPKYIVKKKHYKAARHNLLQMGWIGIFEHFQESVKQIQIYFGKNYIASVSFFLEKLNQNKRKPNIILTKDEIDIILKYNQFDMLLYDLGLVLYKQQQIVAKYKFGV